MFTQHVTKQEAPPVPGLGPERTHVSTQEANCRESHGRHCSSSPPCGSGAGELPGQGVWTVGDMGTWRSGVQFQAECTLGPEPSWRLKSTRVHSGAAARAELERPQHRTVVITGGGGCADCACCGDTLLSVHAPPHPTVHVAYSVTLQLFLKRGREANPRSRFPPQCWACSKDLSPEAVACPCLLLGLISGRLGQVPPAPLLREASARPWPLHSGSSSHRSSSP